MTVLIILLAVCALYLFLIAPAKYDGDASFFSSVFYAHRGLHDGNEQVMENSLKAFQKAIDHGYGMELDVQCTKDGQLVVFHDGNLKRMCGVDKPLHTLTYDELCDHPLPDGSIIPLFSQVLALVDGKQPLIVEVKHDGDVIKNTKTALDLLASYQGAYCMESFHPASMGYVKKHAPHVLRGQLAWGGQKESSQKWGAYIGMKYLLGNVQSRPHFVAYSVPEDQSISIFLMKHLFRPYLAGWTINTQQIMNEAKKHYGALIFESFHPKK